MLKNTKYLQVLTLKADDVSQQLIDPNSVNITLDNAKLYYSQKLQAGYTLYNVTAEGGFANLATKAPGSYICAFTAQPTATYAVASSILSGSGSVAHTDVIMTSIILNSTTFVPVEIGTVTVSGWTNAADYRKMILSYCYMSTNEAVTGYGVYNVRYYRASVTTASAFINSYTTSTTVEDIIVNNSNQYNFNTELSTITLTINNLYSSTTAASSQLVIACSNAGQILATNVYIKYTGAASYLGLARTANASGIQIKNFFAQVAGTSGVYFALNGATLNSVGTFDNILNTTYDTTLSILGTTVVDVTIKYSNSPVQQYIDGKLGLSTSLVQSVTASTLYLEADISQVKRSIRGAYGTIRRQYYSLRFKADHMLDDSLKNFDDQDRLVVYRSDISTLLSSVSAAKIRGYTWTDSAGTTKKYPRIDESFLILATYGSNTHVLAWHKGELKQTVFSDYWPTATYTFSLAFQIWEMPEEVEYRNIYNVTNSPIEGSFTVQDITSKVVL